MEKKISYSTINKFPRQKKSVDFSRKFRKREIYKVFKSDPKTQIQDIDYSKLGDLITFKPTTQSLRCRVIINKKGLINKVEPGLFVTEKSIAGRNNGRISVKSRKGMGVRKLIAINRNTSAVDGCVGYVENLVYYSGTSAHLALVKFQKDKEYFRTYILRSSGLKIGDKIGSGEKADIKEGNNLQLSNIPDGTIIHNVEVKEGKGGALVRSAGTFATLISKELGKALIKLPSGSLIKVSTSCRATIGKVSNEYHNRKKHGGAGYKLKSEKRRSSTRLVAKNPVDGANPGSRQTRKGLWRGEKTTSRAKRVARGNTL